MIMFFSVIVICQTKEKELTQAEQFSKRSGTLIERQFISIGKIKEVEVKVLKIKDLNSEVDDSALRIEYEYRGSSITDTKIAHLDEDEMEGLVKSIKNLQTSVFGSKRESYTEVSFTSRTGFQAGAYFETLKNKWVAFVQVEKYDSKSIVYLTPEDFIIFLTLIENAKSQM